MLFDDLIGWNIILASSSPRRKELLISLGLDFKQVSLPFVETLPDNMNNEDTVAYLAANKADQAKTIIEDNSIVITADTIVCHGNKILGKPESRSEAVSMLKSLSGLKHTVLTGVCISGKERRSCFVSSTEVHFSVLSEKEIEYYIDKYKPYDKAGAYGIQEWIGYIGVEKIEGSYFNVMGLPVQRLYTELKLFINEIDN